jgi:uncharacterized protein
MSSVPVRLYATGETSSEAPGWFAGQRAVLHRLFTDEADPHPCHFAGQGETLGTNYYTHIDVSRGPVPAAELDRLAEALAAFLALPRVSPRHRLSLLCLAGPPRSRRTFEEDRSTYWEVHRGLLGRDLRDWPTEVPSDPNLPGWNFCFAGEPLFTFGASPTYGARRSRVLGDCLVLAFQPATVFDDMRGTALGRAAKARIRGRLARYESVPLLADTGDGVHSTTSKWKQYFPDPDGRPLPDGCPLATETGAAKAGTA